METGHIRKEVADTITENYGDNGIRLVAEATVDSSYFSIWEVIERGDLLAAEIIDTNDENGRIRIYEDAEKINELGGYYLRKVIIS